MTDTKAIRAAALRDKIARIITLDQLQLLQDFDVDGDIYRRDPECAEAAYATADAILALIDQAPEPVPQIPTEGHSSNPRKSQ